jgi:HSP20 family protein
VKVEDVCIEIDENDLLLQGHRFVERNPSDSQFHTMERCAGEFRRRMRIPKSVDKNAVQAEFTDGVLRVLIPKAKRK